MANCQARPWKQGGGGWGSFLQRVAGVELEGSSVADGAELILIISAVITACVSVEQCIRVLRPWPEATGRQTGQAKLRASPVLLRV
ncbi:hypothetical protein COCON_G00194850 [Conger conger]|uniref:Uncharacterized protein n=1 Tax=Conger conger TaxID=82655 RepID=A0A9Q1D0J6_CONCO|nr:hypothetical protein COCON_G00194850 [Conger conger]